MILWRISRHVDLAGIGGLRAGGRWHHAGRPIVYLAESPAAALLEVCVHTAADEIPPSFTLLRILAPDHDIPAIAPGDLPADWRHDQKVTRSLGDQWLRQGESVLMSVPSAIVPATTNYLFNPRHAMAAQFQIAEAGTYPFDGRLKL